MVSHRWLSASTLLAVLVLPTVSSAASKEEKETRASAKSQLGILPKKMPEPAENKSTPAKVELGKKLFFEPRLSASQSISCNSCHNLATHGVDNLPRSIGHEARRGGRNSPTVLNAGFHFVQFWDGRATTLEDQAAGPITNPAEMAMPVDKDATAILGVLRSIPEYRVEFEKVYGAKPEPVNMVNITRSIAAFERTLVSPGRFDDWLAGDDKALTAREKKGLATFLNTGCASCHNGPVIGGQMYQKFGVVKAAANQKDLGRYEVTKQEADKMVFKVPSLRNISHTAPYFHDASAWTLEEAVETMAELQLGVQLAPDDIGDIAAFLRSLDGKPLQVTLPNLPSSTDVTPRPSQPAPSLTPKP